MWLVLNRITGELISIEDCDLLFTMTPMPAKVNDEILTDATFHTALGECISWLDVEYSIEGGE